MSGANQCKHVSLARSCEVCRLEAEVGGLLDALQAAHAERDKALTTLALYRTNPAECVHCGDYDTSREHWRVCSEHPARADVAMLAEALREIEASGSLACPMNIATRGRCEDDCASCIARAALARLKGPTT